MSWLTIIGLGFGVAMDAFAVAVATGMALSALSARQFFRLSFHFGLFQFLMPVIGWFAGLTVADRIQAYDHWIAFALLSFVGGKMLWEARTTEDETDHSGDPTRGWTLVTLSIATSLDALAVGLSLSFINVSIWAPAVAIGFITAAMSALGMWLGHRFGHLFETWAEIVGGMVLIGIGLKILISHLICC